MTETGWILKLLDSEEMQLDEGMNYDKDIDLTEITPAQLAEMKGIRKGWEACKANLKILLTKNKR